MTPFFDFFELFAADAAAVRGEPFIEKWDGKSQSWVNPDPPPNQASGDTGASAGGAG